MSKNFSAPMSAPKPGLGDQDVASPRAPRGRRGCELLPWAMLANGPQWTNAGPPSSVCIRLGLSASLSRTVIEPATLRSSAVIGVPSRFVARTIRPRRARRSLRSAGQREDRHDLGRDGDHELGLARVAVVLAAQAHHDVAQGAVADVQDARPEDVVGVDAELVAVVDVVVDERRGEVVRRADRVDVAGQVEVEVLHRDDLAVAAARGAALDAEHRAEATAGAARRSPSCRSA